ncbi:MAG TPA: thioredoxin domain-containing protein [Gaiellaceae bacterium]
MTAPPPVRSKGVGGARARQASPRVLAIVGGVVLLAVIAIVLGVVLSSGGGGGGGGGTVTKSDLSGLPAVGNANWSGQLDGASDANALFDGIPQTGLVLGKPSAPVEMEMFIDVQCPFCQDYEVNNLPTVVKDDIKSGKVQLHLQPWAFIGGAGSQSFSGRLGLIAASFQNKGYEYAKVLYDNQQPEDTGWLTGRQMALIAASVNGLNLSKWQKSVNGSAVKQIASTVDRLATQAKVQGTPTVLVGCAGGNLQNVTSPTLEPTLEQTQNAISAASCSK